MKTFLLSVLLIASIWLFAIEPTASEVRGVPVSQMYFNMTVPQMLNFQMPAMTVEDTIVTSRIIFPKPIIESIYILVTDTVESQGDSVLFKLFLGGAKILDQKTSAFKLPAVYNFSPIVNTASAKSALYYATENTKSGQTSAITEGSFKVIIKYLNP